MRVVTALGASLLLLAISAGSAAAAPELFTIEIDLDSDPAVETFESDSPLLCDSGTATTFFDHAGGREDVSRAATFHLVKLIECDDGSGSFVITVNAAANFVVGVGTVGGWSVVPGSGTGDYTGLVGGGRVVGINTTEGDIDLVDHYYGSLRR